MRLYLTSNVVVKPHLLSSFIMSIKTIAVVVAGLLSSAAISVHAEVKPVVPSQIRGLSPSRQSTFLVLFHERCESGQTNHVQHSRPVAHHYEPSNGNFTCLDGSRRIPVSAINDDYCDCPDGSDEPGTSACEDTGVRFYCENVGHIPGSVLASRVNDGICGESDE